MNRVLNRLVSRLHLGTVLWPFRKNGLYCFNFHRIGDWGTSDFDPNVFSCSADSFRRYVDFFKKEFNVISLNDLEELIASGKPITDRLALITFDDGYQDNYSIALPILQDAGISATFFITTGLVGRDCLSWWDEFAWHVRRRVGGTIELEAWRESYKITGADIRQDVRNVLNLVKSTPVLVELQIEELRGKYGHVDRSAIEQCALMNWEQVRTLAAAGMSIGAHSHSHEQFSNLTALQLQSELETSKRILEDKLGIEIRSLSYPVGGASSFDATMFDMISDCGYALAFSFITVINGDLSANSLQLGRLPIDGEFAAADLKDRCVVAKKI